jgi:hypothetical protein
MLRVVDQTLAFLASCFGLGDEMVSMALCENEFSRRFLEKKRT